MTKFWCPFGCLLVCTDGVQARDIEVREKEPKKKGSSTAMWQLARQQLAKCWVAARECISLHLRPITCSLFLSLSLFLFHNYLWGESEQSDWLSVRKWRPGISFWTTLSNVSLSHWSRNRLHPHNLLEEPKYSWRICASTIW
jgi:hypothetical protein